MGRRPDHVETTSMLENSGAGLNGQSRASQSVGITHPMRQDCLSPGSSGYCIGKARRMQPASSTEFAWLFRLDPSNPSLDGGPMMRPITLAYDDRKPCILPPPSVSVSTKRLRALLSLWAVACTPRCHWVRGSIPSSKTGCEPARFWELGRYGSDRGGISVCWDGAPKIRTPDPRFVV